MIVAYPQINFYPALAPSGQITLRRSAMSMVPDDETEIVPIPLDRESIANLARLERALGVRAILIASSLLRSALADDAMSHAGLLKPLS